MAVGVLRYIVTLVALAAIFLSTCPVAHGEENTPYHQRQVARAVGKTGEIAFAGKVSSCIECHRQAWDDDFVFFND